MESEVDGSVGSFASSDVVEVDRASSLRDVAARLADTGVGFVIVAEGGSVSGVISERDIVLAVSEGARLDEVRAEDVMSTDLVTIDEGDGIAAAAHVMLDAGVRHLLVGGREGGVVSIRDVLGAMLE